MISYPAYLIKISVDFTTINSHIPIIRIFPLPPTPCNSLLYLTLNVLLNVAGEIEDLVKQGHKAVVGGVVALDLARQVETLRFTAFGEIFFQAHCGFGIYYRAWQIKRWGYKGYKARFIIWVWDL